MDWNSFVNILFPIGIVIGLGIAYFANKNRWTIVKWF
jgi:hypothetical protein